MINYIPFHVRGQNLVNNSANCISSRTWGNGRPQVGLCTIFVFYASPKIRGVSTKNLGPKHAKFGTILH